MTFLVFRFNLNNIFMNYPEEKHSEPLLRNPYEPIAAIPGNPYLQSYPAVDE
jgi:hypothetical protein